MGVDRGPVGARRPVHVPQIGDRVTGCDGADLDDRRLAQGGSTAADQVLVLGRPARDHDGALGSDRRVDAPDGAAAGGLRNLVQAVQHGHEQTLREQCAGDLRTSAVVGLGQCGDDPVVERLADRVPGGGGQQDGDRATGRTRVEQAEGEQDRKHALAGARLADGDQPAVGQLGVSVRQPTGRFVEAAVEPAVEAHAQRAGVRGARQVGDIPLGGRPRERQDARVAQAPRGGLLQPLLPEDEGEVIGECGRVQGSRLLAEEVDQREKEGDDADEQASHRGREIRVVPVVEEHPAAESRTDDRGGHEQNTADQPPAGAVESTPGHGSMVSRRGRRSPGEGGAVTPTGGRPASSVPPPPESETPSPSWAPGA